jgi:hypothetical protein
VVKGFLSALPGYNWKLSSICWGVASLHLRISSVLTYLQTENHVRIELLQIFINGYAYSVFQNRGPNDMDNADSGLCIWIEKRLKLTVLFSCLPCKTGFM